MKIPQTLDELYGMTPEEQRQVGEIFGRLIAFKPEMLPQVTKIRQEDLMALGQGQQPATPGAPSPSLTTLSKGMKSKAYQPDQDTLHVTDLKTQEKRPAAQPQKLGAYDVLVKNGEILRMGTRAKELLK